MKNNNLIADEFGHKIGGSKRDLWKARGLMVSDLEEMNDAEMQKHVKKDSIFKTPNYQEMKDNGMDIKVIYFIKLAKDAIATKPKMNLYQNYRELYVEGVGQLRDALLSLDSWAECECFIDNILIDGGFLKRDFITNSYRSKLTTTPKGEICGIHEIYRAVAGLNVSLIERMIRKKEFLYTDFDKFKKNFRYYKKEGTSFVQEERAAYIRRPGMMALVKGLTEEEYNQIPNEAYILECGYTYVVNGTVEEIEETIKKLFKMHQMKNEATKTEQKTTRKKKFIPQALTECRRIHLGKDARVFMHISPENMLDNFGFYGGEFGNWLNDDTRQESLDRSFEAFEDLATALDITKAEISLNGRLSIAYGARGNGGAAAHYEPAREVINLTKFSGAGTLAHEYGHALDDILAKTYGYTKCFSEAGRTLESMKELLRVMKYKKETVEISKSSYNSNNERDKKQLYWYTEEEFRRASESGINTAKRWLDENIFISESEFLSKKKSDEELDSFIYDYVQTKMNEFEEQKKLIIPRAKQLKREYRNSFYVYATDYLSNITKPESTSVERQTKTDFYKGSLVFDESYSKEDKGYWASDIEMFARCFSCYVEDKLKEKGIVNDYLAGKSDIYAIPTDNGVARAYPVGEERKIINEHIDAFLSELKSLGLFNNMKAA